ncbi:hypothetical protein B0A50_02909 [Salinomyces thailandicus]|uniref:F-box domain-containing protein n=1 Tax=Salinomyces thailandicus TaxID=706561 RepID=A0A4U0U4Z0_9PEZI|nr:hypothetical protein B0A50_02909 [Salinomyces thailandica]
MSAEGFMGLPPELRQKVYDMLLVDELSIWMSTYRRGRRGRRKPCRAYTNPYDWDKSLRRREGRVASGHAGVFPRLLQLNKQMGTEVSPTFYGKNKFAFNSFASLKVFLEAIGANRRHLRFIRMYALDKVERGGRTAFHLLKDATNLRYIAIAHEDACGYPHQTRSGILSELIWACTPLLKSLCEASQKRGESGARVLDILRTDDGHPGTLICSSCETIHLPRDVGSECTFSCGCNVREGAAHYDRLAREVRTLVAKAVKVEDTIESVPTVLL